MDTTSYWIDTSSLPRFPAIKRDLEVDVVVIGGGIMGITAAYLFKQAGNTVALLEREHCAHVDTGHTTAHVTCVTDLRLQEIAREFGRDHARAVWDAGGAAIDQIVNLIRQESIACDFAWVPGFLHAPWENAENKHARLIEEEAKIAQELDIPAQFFPSVPFCNLPGVRFPQQALFHPLKYLSALVRKIPGDGSEVFENSAASEVQGEPLAVKSREHTIWCKYVVLATHNPLMGRTPMMKALLFQTKLALYTTYAIGAKIPSGTIPPGSFWDISDPYNYLRVDRRRGHDYAVFGGEDHKTGQEADTVGAFCRLEQRFNKIVPQAKVDYRWSGQVIETNDGLPFIGEIAGKQFAATGFSGNGMTFGTLAAMMAVDAMVGRKNPWQKLFDIHRTKIIGGTFDYIAENKDYPYYLLRDLLGKSEGKSLRSLKRGQGKILELDGKRVAAYRNEEGEVTLCSAVCTHLKCIVGWNEAEQTWDCPCHGSRFKPTGEVIAGPAEEPLEKIEQPVKSSA